jgi:hypothetical protein
MSRNTPTKTPTRKNKTSTLPPTLTETFVEDGASTSSATTPNIKKKRGRPRKNSTQEDNSQPKTPKSSKKTPDKNTRDKTPKKTPKSAEKRVREPIKDTDTDDGKKIDTPAGVSIRPRKMPTEKKLLLIRPEDLTDIETLESRVTNFERGAHVTEEEYEELLQEDKPSCVEQTPKKTALSHHSNEIPHDSVRIEIITPTFQGIEGVRINEVKDQKKFEIPKKYINVSNNTQLAEKYDIANEYDIQSDDEEWLQEYNSRTRKPLSDPNFERIYALLNREYGTKNGYVSVSGIADLAQLCDVRVTLPDIMGVRDWWRRKNEKLITKLQAQEDRCLQLEEDLDRMNQLRKDLERLRLLMELVRKRERLKHRYIKSKSDEIRILSKQRFEGDLMDLLDEEDRIEREKEERKKNDEEAEAFQERRKKKMEQEQKLREREMRQKEVAYESEDLIEEVEPIQQKRKRRRLWNSES